MSIILINKSERGHKTLLLVQSISVLFVLQYATYVTDFMAFYILLNSLNDTSKGICFYFRPDFCVK